MLGYINTWCAGCPQPAKYSRGPLPNLPMQFWALIKKTVIPAFYERGHRGNYLREGTGTTNETCLGCFSSRRIALESAKIAHDDYCEHFGPFEPASPSESSLNKDGTYVLERRNDDAPNEITVFKLVLHADSNAVLNPSLLPWNQSSADDSFNESSDEAGSNEAPQDVKQTTNPKEKKPIGASASASSAQSRVLPKLPYTFPKPRPFVEEPAHAAKDEPLEKKAKKDPNAPKRPGTSYNLFCEAECARVRPPPPRLVLPRRLASWAGRFALSMQVAREHPEASKMDVQKLLAERWKQADEGTKAKCAGLRWCCDHGGQQDIWMGCFGQVLGPFQAKHVEVRRGDAGVHKVGLEQEGRAQMRRRIKQSEGWKRCSEPMGPVGGGGRLRPTARFLPRCPGHHGHGSDSDSGGPALALAARRQWQL